MEINEIDGNSFPNILPIEEASEVRIPEDPIMVAAASFAALHQMQRVLGAAIDSDKAKLIDALIKYSNGNGRYPIINAIESNDIEAVRLFLDNGYGCMERNLWGHDWSPLVRAIYLKRDEIAKLLIERGHPLDIGQGGNAPPALFFALGRANLQLVELLLKAGANPNTRWGGGAWILIKKDPYEHWGQVSLSNATPLYFVLSYYSTGSNGFITQQEKKQFMDLLIRFGAKL